MILRPCLYQLDPHLVTVRDRQVISSGLVLSIVLSHHESWNETVEDRVFVSSMILVRHTIINVDHELTCWRERAE